MVIIRIMCWKVIEKSDKKEYEHLLREPYAWDKKNK